jgi:hypothetical protein
MNKYSQVKYKDFRSLRNFGVELEIGHLIPKSKIASLIRAVSNKETNISKYQLSSKNNYWHIKEDATCGIFGRRGPKGIEIASYIANGLQDIEHIAEVARFLSLSGCRANDNCGLHIHAEIKDFDVRTAGVLLAYWLKLESWIENLLPKKRINNKYCKRLSDTKVFDRNRYWDAQELFIFFAPTNLGTYENEERRVNLNFVNFVKSIVTGSDTRKTIELRCPEGTLDHNEIKSWLVFYLNFLDSCKERDVPDNLHEIKKIDEVLSIFGLSHDKEVFYIFDDHLHNTRVWLLKRLIQYGNVEYKKQAQKKLDFLCENLMLDK